MAPSPRSPAVLDKIKSWLKECTEQHQHVRPRSTSLPTRVLDITNGGQEVVLCVSDTMQGEYATLSYCWGSVQPATLTSGTVGRLSAGIGVGDLPQTFQDAIRLTYQLGIRYLWIDSLCILQDDPKDWERESSRMSEVYENSSLTIAASRATDSREGFAGERTQTYITLPFQAEGISGEMLAFAVPPKYVLDGTLFAHLEDEPLTERGWTLQERYLSPRTLHFCHSRICFECDHGFIMEDYPSPAQALCSPKLILGDDPARVTKEQRLRTWRRIVTEYSRRKLTVEDDKLPALGGLAAHISSDLILKDGISVPGSRYLAGLWSDEMIRGMCWSIRAHRPSGVRTRKYRAPTWSWASIEGEIDYKTDWFETFNELAIIQNAHVDLDSLEHLFGRVTGGWVYLKALKFRPYMKPNSKFFWFYEAGVDFRMFPDWDSEQYRVPELGKLAQPATGDTELFAILLGWTAHRLQSADDDSFGGPYFLILKAVEHDIYPYARVPGFQRVGFGIAGWITSSEGGTGRDGFKLILRNSWLKRSKVI